MISVLSQLAWDFKQELKQSQYRHRVYVVLGDIIS